MPQRLKFFALFAVLVLTALGFAAEEAADRPETQFSFMGDLRWRYEFRENGDFSSDFADASNFHLARARFAVKAEATENTWGFIQIQDARFWGEEFNPYGVYTITDDPTGTYDASADNLDVHQAYIMVESLWDSKFSLKIGRQELSYGDERHVGADNWNNYGQSFDGAKVMFKSDYFDFDVFYTQHVAAYPTYSSWGPVQPGGAGVPGGNVTFSGFYGTAKPMENLSWDGYVFLLFDGNVAPDKTWLWTIGTRAAGTFAEHLDYTGEFAFQTGNVLGGLDQSAFALALTAGYTFPVEVEPRVGVDFAYATGDDDFADTDQNTFLSLFPSPHGKFGNIDYQDWMNMMNLGLKFSLDPTEAITLKSGFNFFWLAKEDAAWFWPYRGGTFLGGSKTIGNELDLGFSYKYNSVLGFAAGYSRFFTGSALQDNGFEDDQDWFYVTTKLGF